MAQRRIEIVFEADGSQAKVEGFGFSGSECDREMEAIERALGKPVRRVNKPEYAGVAVAAEQHQGTWRK